MRNLIRQPLTWMVIAECVVVALLIVVVWNVVAAAAVQHGAATAAPALATNSATALLDSPLPEVPVGAQSARQVQLPGLNLDARFWRVRLTPLNRDQGFFEQLQMGVLRNPHDA